MTTATTTATSTTTTRSQGDVAREWREGLLQDLVAVSIIVRTVRGQLTDNGDALPLLDAASCTLEADLELVRAALQLELSPGS